MPELLDVPPYTNSPETIIGGTVIPVESYSFYGLPRARHSIFEAKMSHIGLSRKRWAFSGPLENRT